MNKKIIIFDFDGVLVNSLQLSYTIDEELIPGLKYDEWQSWFDGNFYQKVSQEHATDEFQNTFFERYNQRLMSLAPIEEMIPIIQELAERYSLQIISSSTEVSINNFLTKYNLRHYFQEVLGKETDRSKVIKFNQIVNKYNIAPSETLIITDTIGDIREANEAGINSLGVTWGMHDEAKLEQEKPNFIAKNPSEIITGIETILA